MRTMNKMERLKNSCGWANKIDEARDRNAIGDLSVIAYQMINELHHYLKMIDEVNEIINDVEKG